jgi:hypothetical protein
MLKEYSLSIDIDGDGFYVETADDGAWLLFPGGSLFRPGVKSIPDAHLLIPPDVIPIKKISITESSVRHAICKTCPKYQAETDKCGTCGCSSTMHEASMSPWRKCPERKWPEHQTASSTKPLT